MEARPGGTRVVFDWFTSTVLADNTLGDPVTRALPVIVPPGYDATSDRRYPVLYYLIGFTGRGTMMLNEERWEPTLLQRLDRLYSEGMPHVIVVLPDCLTRLGGSEYLNSPATGRYEDYMTQELIPYIDSHYQTIAAREGRGLFGKSSGGNGSLQLAMHHPHLFNAVACHSGGMGFDCVYLPDFPKTADPLAKAGGVVAWMRAFEAKMYKDNPDTGILNILAMAACYSPDAQAPLGLALPFDLETCTLNEEIWAKWQAWDPVAMVARYADSLRQLRLLYFDWGDRDEFFLYYGARRFQRQLQVHQIPHECEEFDGGHFNIDHRYDVSIPKLVMALAQG